MLELNLFVNNQLVSLEKIIQVHNLVIFQMKVEIIPWLHLLEFYVFHVLLKLYDNKLKIFYFYFIFGHV